MSRETVVWTTSKPLSLSAEATSAWVESARSRTRSRIALCRSRRFIVCGTLAEYAVEDPESVVDITGCDGQRGREPDDVLAGGEDEEAALASRIDDVRCGTFDLDPDEQPAPTYGEHAWKRRECLD